ncbi:hypothetical protein GCM10022419_108800 [Nonomuraea rosea]|uniref:Uncharacterized protein n=1 Tax=Nonomuraea rosea TaxID=638574 RepID=A0ABP6ZDL0_9ACTN
MAKLLTDKTAPTYCLLGHTHAVLACLLEAAVRPDAPTPAAIDPDFATVRRHVPSGLRRRPAAAARPGRRRSPIRPRLSPRTYDRLVRGMGGQ